MDLAFHSYKIEVCQQVLSKDYQPRVNFIQLTIELIDNSDNMSLFMSDGDSFSLEYLS